MGFVTPGVILDLLQNSRQESESQAIFADIDWAISDKLTLNIGGRYNEDEKWTYQDGFGQRHGKRALE